VFRGVEITRVSYSGIQQQSSFACHVHASLSGRLRRAALSSNDVDNMATAVEFINLMHTQPLSKEALLCLLHGEPLVVGMTFYSQDLLVPAALLVVYILSQFLSIEAFRRLRQAFCTAVIDDELLCNV